MNKLGEHTTINGPVSAVIDTAQLAASTVSWSAILAGATASAALSLILLILGTGLGFSAVSPWAHNGVSATTFGVSTIVWLTVTQLVAFGLGGYLAGRLRTRWAEVHQDEVHFRDTAHGLLTWAVASLATATLLTSVIGSIVSGGVKAGAAAVGGIGATAGGAAMAGFAGAKSDGNRSLGYFVDSLFRADMTSKATDGGASSEIFSPQNVAMSRSEVTRILLNTVQNGGTLPTADLHYVAQMIAQRTGLSPQDAETRVSDTVARVQNTLREAETTARETADRARKASAYAALWLFVALLSGAFIASLTATYGGRRRDI